MNQRIPVTIVTGFLGSGKTTLISNLISNARSQRFAILVNEFGEISIDDTIIRKHARPDEVEIHNLTSGLVAYSPEDSFMPTMLALNQRRELVDHVLVETSGLAVPTAIIEKLQSEQLKSLFILDATINVVDTPLLMKGTSGETTHENSPAHVRELLGSQLEAADVVVLNKIDSFSEDTLLEAEHMVRQMVPTVRFIELAYGAQLDPGLVLGLHLNQTTAEHSHGLVPAGVAMAVSNGHSHSGIGSHDHGILTHEHLHEHDPGWMSFVVRSHHIQDPKVINTVLSNMASSFPVLRVKGFIAMQNSKHTFLVQAVRSRVTVSEQEAHPHEYTHSHLHSHSHSHSGLDDHHDGKNHHMHDHEDVHDHEHGHEHGHEHENGHEHVHDHEHSRDHEHNHRHPSELVFIGYHLSRENVIHELNRHTSTEWE